MKRIDFLKTTGIIFAGILSDPLINGLNISEGQDLASLLIDSNGKAIRTLPEWIEQRKVILKRWNDYLGIIDPNPDPPKMNILSEGRTDGLIRQLVEYESEPGVKVPAYLLKPQKIAKKLPAIVALHSTSDNQMKYIAGVEKGNIKALGYNLARMGFIVICPMCFLWHDKGDRTYEQQVELFHQRHPGSKGMARMLFDAQRAVDVLISLEEVDSARIGAVGHSLGGKESFYLGAFDERVKVIVSNEGGIGISFSNWDAVWYLGGEIRDFHHEHHELLALCAPRPFLLIGGDSSDGKISVPYIEAVKPVYSLYGKLENIKLYNHGQGHNITPAAEKLTYNWVTGHLNNRPGKTRLPD
jgi:hypothetical protein